jgi:hypothetical protein
MSTHQWFATALPVVVAVTSNAKAADAPRASDDSTATPAAAEQRETPAPKREHLGQRGQVLITSGAQLDMRRSLYASPFAGISGASSISLAPSLDYMLTDHWTVGASIALGLSRADEGSNGMFFSVSPRLGYLVPLGSSVSLWPQFHIAYGMGSVASAEYTQWSVGGAAPIIVELAPHFFVGAGPDFTFTRTTINLNEGDLLFSSSGVTTLIGGWI